jgi:septal ring factor EnvC (AmiA/AmiB activator)
MELKSHYEQLEEYCKTLEEKLDASHLSSQEIDLRLQKAERKYEQDLREEAERYGVLARESDLLQQGYQEGL